MLDLTMKVTIITTLLLIGLLSTCEKVIYNYDTPPSQEILIPNDTTVWRHWLYDASIQVTEINFDTVDVFIQNAQGDIYPLSVSPAGISSVTLQRPVYPYWGSGPGFRIGLARSGVNTIYSKPFTIENIDPPQQDLAKVLTLGTKYFYTQNTDEMLSYWQEEVVGDTSIDGVNYSVVSGYGWRHKPIQRSDASSLYYFSSNGEDLMYDLNLSDTTSNRIVFGLEVPFISKSDGDATLVYTKYFGQTYYSIFNMQWMTNSWSLSAVRIDGVVYGDTTEIGSN